MNGTTLQYAVNLPTEPTDWSIAGTGDFNGDGKADIIWQNTVTGQRLIWIMNGTTLQYAVSLPTEPTDWSIAGSGDFNGDGKSDIIWQNTITGAARYLDHEWHHAFIRCRICQRSPQTGASLVRAERCRSSHIQIDIEIGIAPSFNSALKALSPST